MFLKDEAKTAIENVNNAKSSYELATSTLTEACAQRYTVCSSIKDEVQQGINFIENALSAKIDVNELPDNLSERLHDEFSSLTDAIKELDDDIIAMTRDVEGVGGAGLGVALGVGAGAAVGSLGPTALLAYASTFGVASTGTAISTLSGAAATNASLAYLGLGGGMAAGEVVLGLAGPIGWGIAAISLVGGGLYYRNKNKKTIEKAVLIEKELVQAETETLLCAKQIKLDATINAKRVKDTVAHVAHIYRLASDFGISDELVKELYLLEENVKQLTSYVNKRILANPET